MLSWEAHGSAPPPPRAMGRFFREAASGWYSGCLRSGPTSSRAPAPARASLNPALSGVAAGDAVSPAAEELVGCWASCQGCCSPSGSRPMLWLWFVTRFAGQGFGGCSGVGGYAGCILPLSFQGSSSHLCAVSCYPRQSQGGATTTVGKRTF